MDTRKESDRRCTFWLEFENGSRLHVLMLDEPEVDEASIPPYDNSLLEEQNKKIDSMNETSKLAGDGDLEGRNSQEGGGSILKNNDSPSKPKDIKASRDSNPENV